ncbi:MAG: hypothetical protein ACREGI_04365, partial [Candidatus Levyibacteriota bacterium]
VIGKIVDNRRVFFARRIAENYISFFDSNWLFIKGDIERHHAPQMGLLYLWTLPFILIGTYMLIFGKYNKKLKLFLFLWFFIVPVPASITSGVPHAVRALNYLPLFDVFTAIGILAILDFLAKYKRVLFASYVVGAGFLLFNILFYLNQYFVQLNYFYADFWQYGYNQVFSTIDTLGSEYNSVIISNDKYLDQSYVFFLFHYKYSPNLYQKHASEFSGGFGKYHAFGKFVFRPIDWNKDAKMHALLVSDPLDVPASMQGLKVVKKIFDPQGKEIIDIIAM